MIGKFLLAVHCIAAFGPVIAQNSATIPPSIFENYKKGATQFISIIDYLLPGVGTAKPIEWAQQLQNDVKALSVPFQASLTESESEKTKLDQSTVDLVTKSSELETQISQLQSAVGANQVLVSSNENQVSDANNHVQNAENSLASTERALNDLEQKLSKARNNCLGRRRRKRFLGGVWRKIKKVVVRPITKPIEKAVCRLVGEITGSIDRAKNQRNDARGVRDNAVNMLNDRKRNLDAARQQLTSSQEQLANKQSELNSVNQQLNGRTKASCSLFPKNDDIVSDFRAQIVAVGAVNQGLKSVIEHIDKILVGSAVLKRFVDDLSLLDLNTLIEPLEHIGVELIKSTPGAETLKFPTLSQDQITSIRNNLKTLSEQLPNETVISNDVTNVE